MPPPFRSRAHLVVWLRVDCGIPSVIDCHIHSSGPMSLGVQPNVVYAEIAQIEGDSFQEAHDRMMDMCRKFPSLAWTRMFLEKEDRWAFVNQVHLNSALRRGMPGYSPGETEWPHPKTEE